VRDRLANQVDERRVRAERRPEPATEAEPATTWPELFFSGGPAPAGA
jgi:hypothetical protein